MFEDPNTVKDGIMASSYIFYAATVLMVVFFAWLAQKFSYYNKKGIRVPHFLFNTLSMGILIFVMGFRAQTAVDDMNYLRGYLEITSMPINEYYEFRKTEPLFVLLNYFTKFIFDDYQWLIVISTIITIYFFYKALSYELDKISYPLAIFIFSLSHYFYFFGILKLGLAASIIAFGYRYILKEKRYIFVLIVLIAFLFHYSALFALILLFYKTDSYKRIKKNTLIKITTIILLAFFVLRLLSPYLLVKYQSYFDSSVSFDLGFVNLLPFLLIFLFNHKKLRNLNPNNELYLMLFFISFIIQVLSPIIGTGRMVWYVSLSNAFLLPAVIRVNKSYFVKYLYFVMIIGYYAIYSYYAYFGDSYRSSFMLPYENIFFYLK
jgi:hypothetical protein